MTSGAGVLAEAPVGGGAVPMWAAGVAVVTAAWVGLTLAGSELSLFTIEPVGTAAAAVCAAVTGARWRPAGGRRAILAGSALIVLPLGVAVAAGGSVLLLGAVLGVVALGELAAAVRPARPPGRRRDRLAGAAALVVAVGLGAAAVVFEGGERAVWELPRHDVTAAALGLCSAALLAAVATTGPSRRRPLLVPALVVGLAAVAAFTPLYAAAAASAAAALWAASRRRHPAPALAALAVAAAAVPAAGPAMGLLAAAAALGAVVDHPAAALLAVPGVAALLGAVVATSPDGPLVALAAGTALTCLLLVRAAATAVTPGARPWGLESVPAALLGGWLVLAPGSWHWTGAEGLGAYDRGALVAAGAISLLLTGRRAAALLAGVRSAAAERARPARPAAPDSPERVFEQESRPRSPVTGVTQR